MESLSPLQRDVINEILDMPSCLSTPKELEAQALLASRAFSESDADNNGTLSLEEITKMCEIMGLPIDMDDNDYFDRIDADGSDTLSELEFLKWWLIRVSKLPGTQSQQEVMARNTFKRFDENGSGDLSISELSKLASILGVDFTDEELQQAIIELDKDNSGLVTCDEFVSWWSDRSSAVRRGGGLIAYKLKRLANKAARVFYTDIHTAVWKGDLELVRMFLEGEKKLCDATDPTEHGDDWTPLHYAAYQGNIPIIEELLKCKCKVDALNTSGFTPLFFATQRNHIAVCELLMEKGADPSICGKNVEEHPTVHYMCPAEFTADSELIRNIMSVHKCWFIPRKPPGTGTAAISLSATGLITIIIDLATKAEAVSNDKKNEKKAENKSENKSENRNAENKHTVADEVSKLPIKYWRVIFLSRKTAPSNPSKDQQDVVLLDHKFKVIPNFDNIDYYIVHHQILKQSNFIIFKEAVVSFAAVNIAGEGPMSDFYPIQMLA
eukprot:gene4111-8169_t